VGALERDQRLCSGASLYTPVYLAAQPPDPEEFVALMDRLASVTAGSRQEMV